MKVKVKVDSNLQIKNVFEPLLEIELRNDENTLKDILQKLSGMYPFLKFIMTSFTSPVAIASPKNSICCGYFFVDIQGYTFL